MSEPTKFCKDCKWAQRSFFGRVGGDSKCTRALKSKRRADYLVTGTVDPDDMFYCSTEREEWIDGKSCGPSGKYWEPRK